jgi:hypothetical protein
MEVANPESPISALPDELLLNIFWNMHTVDWCEVAKVCRRWRRVTQDPSLWSRVDFTTNLAWKDLPENFLQTKWPLVFQAEKEREKSVFVQKSNQGFCCASCYVKALKSLGNIQIRFECLDLSNVQPTFDKCPKDCPYHQQSNVEESINELLLNDRLSLFPAKKCICRELRFHPNLSVNEDVDIIDGIRKK